MKKMLLLMSTILIATTIQAYKSIEGPPYKGIAVIDSGVIVDGGKILIDNAYKQHVLLKKAEQWLLKNYDKNVILIAENTITVNTKDYRLLLEFKDGVFEYCFTNKIKDEKKLMTIGQQIIDNLSQYVLTCRLENNTW
jgi:hypothetical protein